ncbi:MAG: FliA/WhiG family RNA polymerase sigma factor [Gemmatimonadota bacterium]
MRATMRQPRTEYSKDAMVRQHLPLVYHVARRMHNSLGAAVQLDDLVSAGSLGLLEAVASFDHRRGLAFSTFAAPRIRGAILDDMRKSDLLSRSARQKQREVSAARTELEQELHRQPTQLELAGELNVPLDMFWRWQSDASSVTVSIDTMKEATPADFTINSCTANERSLDDELSHEEEVELLKTEIEALPERDRLVLTLSYFQGLKLSEIGQALGITEGRVSQLRTRAVATLRGRMAHLRTTACAA